MISALLQVLGAALQIWQHEEKDKYLNEYLSLRKEYEDAIDAPAGDRDNVLIDGLERRLQLCAIGWATTAQRPDPGTSQ